MTNQEAIDTIRRVIARIEWDYPMDCVVALEMAVEALEREIPVKVGIGGDQKSTWWEICPVCKKAVDRGDEYCASCGRKVTWDA